MTDTADRPARPRRSRRGAIALLLVIVGATLLPFAGLTVWVRNQVLSTDRYVETMSPLAEDPAVQAVVADRVSRRVIENINLEDAVAEALDDLSPRAAALAPLIAAGAQNVVRDATARLLASDEFPQIWERAIRVSHGQLVGLLTGREGKALTTDSGQVVLQLGAISRAVADEVEQRFGIEVPDAVMERLDVEFVLFESEDLASAQDAVRLLDRVAWIGLILTLGLFGAAVAIDPVRRRGLRRVGIGIVVSMTATLLLLEFGRTRYLEALPDRERAQESGAAVFDTLTRFVYGAFRTFLVLGLVLIVIAWVSGDSSTAQRVRSAWQGTVRRAGSSAGDAVDLGPVPRWVAAHARGLHIAIAALAVAMLVTRDHPTGLTVLGVALVALVAAGLVAVVANASRGSAVPEESSAPG